VRAWILSIGNELLIGRTVNTNAAWLGRRLTLLGVSVKRILVVPDELDEIASAFREAMGAADLVVSTGGLGPTPDDVTNMALARALGRELVVHPDALREVEAKYAAKGYAMSEERRKMAMLPSGCSPISNPVGVAPGILCVEGGSTIVALPGVPAEMEAMFEQGVEPMLRARLPPRHWAEASITIVGIPEADLAPAIRRVWALDPRLYAKSHPKGHEVEGPIVEVHVYASAETREEAEELVRRGVELLRGFAESRGGRVQA